MTTPVTLAAEKSASDSPVPRPSYIAPEADGKGPGGFVCILGSKHCSPTLSPAASIELVAVRNFDILLRQTTANEGYRHAMLHIQTADMRDDCKTGCKRYCVQLNPMAFSRARLEREKMWDEIMADLTGMTDFTKVPFITITDDPEQTENDSLGKYDFAPDGKEVKAYAGVTVADLETFAQEWLRKNPAYVFDEADCRHFAHAAYNELKQSN